MNPILVVEALLRIVLQLVDRGTAKTTLDRLAVAQANADADEVEKRRFSPQATSSPQG